MSQPQSVDDQILDRLVTLNAQRAEEERNGHIRWLRPDYQNPGQTSNAAQTETPAIPGMEIPKAQKSIAPTPAKKQKWPQDFKDQLAAIRDLLRTQGGEWNLVEISKAFTGAARSQTKIQTALEALETLGLVAQHSENNETNGTSPTFRTLPNLVTLTYNSDSTSSNHP
ncbi:MAG: hypothetical protein HC824_10045 [Synechococcales cyanobacterium RM1_1_8]|nr:hypothetical protein [Synechococcales cyanobacterium RM1_1_8]